MSNINNNSIQAAELEVVAQPDGSFIFTDASLQQLVQTAADDNAYVKFVNDIIDSQITIVNTIKAKVPTATEEQMQNYLKLLDAFFIDVQRKTEPSTTTPEILNNAPPERYSYLLTFVREYDKREKVQNLFTQIHRLRDAVAEKFGALSIYDARVSRTVHYLNAIVSQYQILKCTMLFFIRQHNIPFPTQQGSQQPPSQ